jgi:flagellar biosynthetic protein FliQ
MNDTMVLEIGRDTLSTMLMLMGPPLIISLFVGVGISILQAATQIHEMTLATVPKILAIFLTLAILGPWMTTLMIHYSTRMLGSFADFVR